MLKVESKLLKVCTMLLTVMLIVACVPLKTEQPLTVTASALPSQMPLSTPVSVATATEEPLKLTPSPVTTLTAQRAGETSQLPDLVLGLGVSNPRFACADEAQGQIWLTHYPYHSSTPLLSAEKVSYSQPLWSPDGMWIAFVKSDSQNGTDSIWLIHPDGSELHQLSTELSRQEIIDSGICVPNAGVFNLVGWSPDSRWLTFFYCHVEVGQPAGQNDWYLVNVEQGQTKLIQKNIQLPMLPTWSPDGLKLAFADDRPRIDWRVPLGTKQITLLKVEPSAVTTSEMFSLPEALPNSFGVDQLFWSKSGEALYASLYDTAYRPLRDSPSALWRLDTQRKEWQKIAELGIAYNIVYSEGRDLVAACNEKKGGTIIEVSLFDLTNQSSSKIEDQPWLECSSMEMLEDDSGNNLLGFVSPRPGPATEVWITAARPAALGQKILTSQSLNFPEGLEIESLAWRPPS